MIGSLSFHVFDAPFSFLYLLSFVPSSFYHFYLLYFVYLKQIMSFSKNDDGIYLGRTEFLEDFIDFALSEVNWGHSRSLKVNTWWFILPVFFFLTFLAVALSSSISFSGNFAPFALRRKASICWEFNGSIGFDCGIWPSISDLNDWVEVTVLPVSQKQRKNLVHRKFYR